MSPFNLFYDFLRAGTGWALVIGGLSYLIGPRRDALRLYLGVLFLCLGILFSLSALSPLTGFQRDLDAFIQIGLVFALSMAFYRIILTLMGGPSREGLTRITLAAALAWSVLLLAVPLLDYVLPQGPHEVTLEDNRPIPPLHGIALALQYLLPVTLVAASFAQSRWKISDIPLKSPKVRHAILFGSAAVPLLLLIPAASVRGSVTLYRAAHGALELYLTAMYLAFARQPEEFFILREEIAGEHGRRVVIEEAESAEIRERLDRLVSGEKVYTRCGLTLESLAERLGVPPYRLSRYLAQRLSTTFPAWLNGLRVEYVRTELEANPGRPILEVAFEAGYQSKTAFNKQFLQRTGMTPSEYRKKSKT